MPLVSVLLPVFNGERYLREAVDSVLAQGFTDVELLIVDDGSTDRSLEIARAYERSDRRVQVRTRENRGLVATLNELLAWAQGEFVARMDADDVCLPDRLQRQVDFLRAHADVVCVGGDHVLIDEHGRSLTTVRTLTDDVDIQREALRGTGTLCHPTVTMRTAAVRAMGGYRAPYYPAEDLDLWLRLGEIGKLANLREPVLRYRVHAGSISSVAAQGRQRDAMRRGCEAAWERRGIVDGEFASAEPWRATGERESQFRFSLRYGWWAFNSGERRTGALYGMKAIRELPWAREGWVLLAASLLKPARRVTPYEREGA